MEKHPIVVAVERRDRNVVLLGLTAVILLAALYTLNMTRDLVPDTSFQQALDTFTLLCNIVVTETFSANAFMALFAMWAVMQVAMMSPSAVPMTLAFTKLDRYKNADRSPYFTTAVFFIGYLVVWALYSVFAALIQWQLNSWALLTPTGASASPYLAGVILIGAGLFQFSQLKQSCLNHCRSPLPYLMANWTDGAFGAFKMGFQHGIFCVGCCWVLMALLFVAGVMNLIWMAVITVFVLIEKVAPRGDLFGKFAGYLFLAWGGFLLITAVI